MSAISRIAVAVLFFTTLFTLACGGGSGSDSGTFPPIFVTPTPGIASEGAPFTYTLQANDPQGGAVTFALVSGPTGATLSGATINWTPTHAQSRQPNTFTVKAMSRSGASATTSFSVTPAGTIRGTSVVTYWRKINAQQVPNDLSNTPPQILVPDGNGNYTTFSGQGAADGSFSIPNVPAGYYWLQYPSNVLYWTNSNDIDLGRDIPGHPLQATSVALLPTITGNFNLSDMDPWGSSVVTTPGSPSPEYLSSLVGYSPEAGAGITVTTVSGYGSIISDGSTSFVGQLPLFSFEPIDAAAGDTSYIMQSRSSSLGGDWSVTRTVKALGPVQITLNESATSVDISGQFQEPQKASTRFNVKGAGFAAALGGTNPDADPSMFSVFSAATLRVFDTGRYSPITIFLPDSPGTRTPGFALASLTKSSNFSSGTAITDFDTGDVTFVNPYLGTTVPLYVANQEASVLIFQSSYLKMYFGGRAGYTTTTAPDADRPYDLPMRNVQNPQVNGTSLFQITNVTQPVTLKWDAPPGLGPSGYEVTAVDIAFPACGGDPMVGLPGIVCPEMVSSLLLKTTNTSLTLPQGLLRDGDQYVFTIHAVSDSATDYLKAPNRGSWNRAYSDVVSKLITVGAVAPAANSAPVQTSPVNATKQVFLIGSDGTMRSFSCKDESAANCVQ